MKSIWYIFLIFFCTLIAQGYAHRRHESSDSYYQLSDSYYQLSVCAIFQNEASYLQEWIDHHRKNGVDFFLLYNNNSTDDYKQVLRKYEKAGIVTVVDWLHNYTTVEEWNKIQVEAYTDAVHRLTNISKWCAFLDTDEFLFCPNGKSIPTVLKKYGKFAGVVVNWVVYGTSNKEKIRYPEKMLSELVYRSPLDHPVNKHVKSIVRPKFVQSCSNPHYFVYSSGLYAVNENFERVDGPFTTENHVTVFRINHYWARDLDFLYNQKIPRRTRWGHPAEDILLFERECNQVYDPILLK